MHYLIMEGNSTFGCSRCRLENCWNHHFWHCCICCLCLQDYWSCQNL